MYNMVKLRNTFHNPKGEVGVLPISRDDKSDPKRKEQTVESFAIGR